MDTDRFYSLRAGNRVAVRQAGELESDEIVEQRGEIFWVKRDAGFGYFAFDFTADFRKL